MLKKVLITGATSFIGRNLIKNLLEKQEYTVIALVRKASNSIELLPKNSKLRIIFLDMEDYQKLASVLSEPIDILIHLAWGGTRGSDRVNAQLQQDSYLYSMYLLNQAILLGCRTFIGAGSQAEYGITDQWINEEFICNPVTEYGKQKLNFYNDALKICRSLGLSYKEPRFFSLYGSDDSKETMILSVLINMLSNKECGLTECKQTWNFLNIQDAVDGIIKLLDVSIPDGAYNFGSDDTRPLKDFILEMKYIAQSTSELRFGIIPHNDTGSFGIHPKIDKLKAIAKWKPQIDFSQGIIDIIRYLKSEKNEKN
jgi:nucleoside-diphosphate-sugar epimerase